MTRLFGRIYEPSVAIRGVESWIASLAVIRASRSVAPAVERARRTLATSGPRSLSCLDRYGQPLLFSRMSTDTYVWASAKSTRTWKTWVTGLRQDCLQRTKLALLMRGLAFSLWPTPNAPNGGRTLSSEAIEVKGKTSKGKRQVGLETVAKNWSTPRAADSKGVAYQRDRMTKGKERLSLTGEAKNFPTPQANPQAPNLNTNSVNAPSSLLEAAKAINWPTESARDWKNGQASEATLKRNARPLNEAAVNWPTPKGLTGGANTKRVERGAGGPDLQEVAKNWETPKSCDGMKRSAGNRKSSDLSHQAAKAGTNGNESSEPSLALNPLFDEWLMGWPLGWTDSGFAASESFRYWLDTHSALLRMLLES